MKHKLSAMLAILTARGYVLVTNKREIVDIGGGAADEDAQEFSLPAQITRSARDMRDRLTGVIEEVERIHGIFNEAKAKVQKRPSRKATKAKAKSKK